MFGIANQGTTQPSEVDTAEELEPQDSERLLQSFMPDGALPADVQASRDPVSIDYWRASRQLGAVQQTSRAVLHGSALASAIPPCWPPFPVLCTGPYLEPPMVVPPVYRCENIQTSNDDCYLPDHGFQVCLNEGSGYPTVDEAWNDTPELRVVEWGEDGLPGLACQLNAELVRRAWALLKYNTDIINWIIDMLQCTYPELVETTSNLKGVIGARFDVGSENVIHIDKSECSLDALASSQVPDLNLSFTLEERVHPDRLTPDLPPSTPEYAAAFDPRELVMTIHRGDCDDVGVNQVSRHWRTVFGAYSWGDGAEQKCAVLMMANSILHEMLHQLGLQDVNGLAFRTDVPEVSDASDHGRGVYCDYYHQVGNTFKWAMSRRLSDILQAPCCQAYTSDKKFFNICNSAPTVATTCVGSERLADLLAHGECDRFHMLQPREAPNNPQPPPGWP